ncbi:class I SAM-dependent methyltransferase [Candidatus Pelagibacter sp.]|nr:class I SAM-dependent methyltransferase [Candidatus Pelagibacter sp.]
MGIVDKFKTEKSEVDDIVNFYRINTSQNKFLIFKRYFKEFVNRLSIYLFDNSRIRETSITKKIYNKTWKRKDINKWFDPNENVITHFYKNKHFMASAGLSQRIWQYLIIEKIRKIKPKKVLEVASGNGINLKILAECFDNIEFTGIDFSEVGINHSNEIKNRSLTPEMIRPLDFKISSNTYPQSNLNFLLKDASNLDFLDNEFDLIFTCLGLEQMNDIKFDALNEIKRCAKSDIILIEPFKDLNNFGIRYFHHKTNNYFDLSYNEIPDENFKILEYKVDYPRKLSLKVGMLHLIKK